MGSFENIGAQWLADEVAAMVDEIIHLTPSEYNEGLPRYLPSSVSSMPGPISFEVNEYMREIIDNFDVNNEVRESILMKGVQITYTTALESGIFYFMGHVKTAPIMYVTADNLMAETRMENNIRPMLQHSGMSHIIRSNDASNKHKTGNTKKQIEFEGGGYLKPQGANNANRMRADSINVMLMDEVDGWPLIVGKDGDPLKLLSDRCKGFWHRRKIFIGSTPLIKGTSHVEKRYLRGDQRKYMVPCLKCRHPQELRWNNVDSDTGIVGGMIWQVNDGTLDTESVRYCCVKCGHPHHEYDKRRLFSAANGAKWVPTAQPSEPGIRSYHLPAMYSPAGMAPWYSLVADYLAAFDPDTGKPIDYGLAQVFHNNVFARTWEVRGLRITRQAVSGHTRSSYRLGQIPNRFAAQYSGSKILFLTMQVDVHDSNLAVAVMGWTKDARCYVIDYWRFEDKDCTEIDSPVWQQVRDLIEEKTYVADDKTRYKICITLVDAGYSNAVITNFCSEYRQGVYPILGRDRPAKNQKIKEFDEWTAQDGTIGYKILVDHYKDRWAPALRREWGEEEGRQPIHHFNAPIDITTPQLIELTREYKAKKIDKLTGGESYYWHRPGNAPNELWDLLVYGNAAVEIKAWAICIKFFELDTVNWPDFWRFCAEEENDALFSRNPPKLSKVA